MKGSEAGGAQRPHISTRHRPPTNECSSTTAIRGRDTRRAIWERVGRQEAERLALVIGEHPRSIEERIARARAWTVLELYEPAWNELRILERTIPPGHLRARIRADVLILSYYLAHHVDEADIVRAVETEAESDRRVLADLHLGLALRAAARNDLHEAERQVYFGLDLARLAQQQPSRELLPLLRVQAHVLAQAACYRDALRASELALTASRSISDTWETGRSAYSKGFVLWCQGRPREAIAEFDDALALTQAAASSLPRWIRCSRARALAMLGRADEAESDLAGSSHQLPEDVAYLAIARGDPEVAARVLESLVPEGDPFVLALFGISESLDGRVQRGEGHLAAAEVTFAAGGLTHYSLATRIHLGFCREQQRHGAGRRRARSAAAELIRRGAHGFAWPHPAVAAWLRSTVADDHRLVGFGGPASQGTEQYLPIAARLREVGLTRREADIVLHISSGPGRSSTLSRKTLAAELGISPDTLRVHIMRIRNKLDVDGRGDTALLAALERCAFPSADEPQPQAASTSSVPTRLRA